MLLQEVHTKKRIESIDILRGIVMVIMALDHVRDCLHVTANVNNPLDLETTTPLLFFTRWITHFCAPVFVFLSGTSIYLQSLRKAKAELSSFLILRGLWLILIEISLVSFAWSFNPHYNFIFLQVIWAIGISMVLLGLFVWLPYRIILICGLLIVLGHNLLDIPESVPRLKAGFWWDLLHHGFFSIYSYSPDHSVFIVYPFLPWLGLMMTGYCAGVFFTDKFSQERRGFVLRWLGISLVCFFVILRYTNLYGNPEKWSEQKDTLFTLMSFLDVHKYPPSLLYMCITMGPSLILLSYLEKIQNGFTAIMRVFGRVAFFYYILHLYVIHLIATVCFFARGHSLEDSTKIAKMFPAYFIIPGEGYSLGIVYLIWIAVVVALYPICNWYNNYKSLHKEKAWLSYI
jgi:uncharacterized membrane protein